MDAVVQFQSIGIAIRFDGLQEARAQVLNFSSAPSPDAKQRLGSRGTEARHIPKSGVAEKYERRHTTIIGDFAPQFPKMLKQAAVDAVPGFFVESSFSHLG